MLDKLRAVQSRFEELEFKSGLPDFYADPKRAAKLLREKNDLEPIVACYQAYLAAQQEQLDAEELMADPEMKEFCQETYREARQKQEELYRQLQLLISMKLNIIPTVSNLGRYCWIGAVLTYPENEILVHGQIQGGKL